MLSGPKRAAFAGLLLAACAGLAGCAGQTGSPAALAAAFAAQGQPAAPPRAVRVDPFAGGGAARPAGLTALEAELRRGMGALAAKGSPPPYYLAYEVYDKNDVTISASHGALVQSSGRRSRILDTDVRVGDYKVDSTHIIRSSEF